MKNEEKSRKRLGKNNPTQKYGATEGLISIQDAASQLSGSHLEFDLLNLEQNQNGILNNDDYFDIFDDDVEDFDMQKFNLK